jgi:uncharacterized protein
MVICTLFILINCKQGNRYTLKYIYDYEKVLDDDQKMRLDKLFVELEQKTTNEIVLVTTENYGNEDNIDLYSLDFKVKHLIGKKNKDNGILIVFSKKKSEVKILPGSDLQKLDKSGKTNYVIKSIMIPKFEKKEYFNGLWEGSLELIKYLEESK